MGNPLGNLVALALIVVAALVGFISIQASAITFIGIAYTAWLIVLVMDIGTRPPKNAPLCSVLRTHEVDIYRKYHVYLWAPGAGQAFSAAMNGFRIAGFVWGGLCIWYGEYILGTISIAYFFVSGSLILRMDPVLYMSRQAQAGNEVAYSQITGIESVQERMRQFHSDDET